MQIHHIFFNQYNTFNFFFFSIKPIPGLDMSNSYFSKTYITLTLYYRKLSDQNQQFLSLYFQSIVYYPD